MSQQQRSARISSAVVATKRVESQRMGWTVRGLAEAWGSSNTTKPKSARGTNSEAKTSVAGSAPQQKQSWQPHSPGNCESFSDSSVGFEQWSQQLLIATCPSSELLAKKLPNAHWKGQSTTRAARRIEMTLGGNNSFFRQCKRTRVDQS